MNKTSNRFKQISNSIHVVALVGSLFIALPVSAILQEARGCTMNGTTILTTCTPASIAGESSITEKSPAKPCPLLQLRAGLVFSSVKPATHVNIVAANTSIGSGCDQSFPPIIPTRSFCDSRIVQPRLHILRI